MVPPRQPTRAELSLDCAYPPAGSAVPPMSLWSPVTASSAQATPACLSDEEPDAAIADSTPMSSSSPRVMTPVYLSDTSPVATGT